MAQVIPPSSSSAASNAARTGNLSAIASGFKGDSLNDLDVANFLVKSGYSQDAAFNSVGSFQNILANNQAPTNTGFFSSALQGTKNAFSSVFGGNREEFIPMAGLTEGPDRQFAMDHNTDLANSLRNTQNRFQNIGTILQGVGSIAGVWQGFEALKESRKTRKQQDKQFQMQYNASRTSYNNELERRREIATKQTGTYSDSALKDYMDKHAIV